MSEGFKLDQHDFSIDADAAMKQRQEDEEAGRLLRELTPQVEWQDDGTWYVSGWKPGDDDWTRVTGPTPAAALRALRDAIGGEG